MYVHICTYFVYPHQVLAELKKSNFTLLNQSVKFDDNGDPKFGSFSIVFWTNSGDAEEVGFYKFHSSTPFFINTSKIQWFTNNTVSCFSYPVLLLYTDLLLCFGCSNSAGTCEWISAHVHKVGLSE